MALCLLAGSRAVGQTPAPERTGPTPSTPPSATADPCPPRATLTLPSTVSSFLGNGSCSAFDPVFGSYYFDNYVFSAIAGQTILVNYSAQFSGLTAIQDYYRGNTLADSSACGPATSCAFSYTAPASSLYILNIKAFGFGTYTLNIGAETGSCDFKPLVRDQVTDGSIDTTGCGGSNPPLYFDVYQFQATAGETLRMTYTAVSLPSLNLQIDGPGSSWGHTFSSGQGSVILDFAVQTTGTYSLFAKTQNPSETGSYTILVTNAPPTTATTMSLSSRFDVSATWHTTDGQSGQGRAVPVSTDTGYFWFFSGNNVELVVKTLDGRGINGKWWVFYGALSNVEYTITVTDTTTGAVKVYTNPQGTLASVADTSAF